MFIGSDYFTNKINFLPDGVEGGAPATGSSSEPAGSAEAKPDASSSDVKADVSSEKIATHDDKGVPYYNRYRELEDKYKGVDLDKWKELSGIDLTAYKSEKEWMDLLLGEKELYEQVLGIIKGYKKPAPAAVKTQDDPALVEMRKKLESLENWKTATEKEREEIVSEQVRTEYESRYGKEVTAALKAKGIASLSAIEKQWLRNTVDNEYKTDWEQSQATKTQPKIGWNELPKLVQKHLATVDSARREALKGSVRKDGSPDAMHGGGSSQFMQKPPSNETKAQRVQRIANELKDGMAGPVI